MFSFDEVVDRCHTDCVKYDGIIRQGATADILPMWVADMDFKAAEPIREAVLAYAKTGLYGYTIKPEGYDEAVLNWLQKRHKITAEAQMLVQTPGVVFGLATAVRAYTQPGDGVMIQTPVYPPFHAVIRNNHRQIVENPLINKDGYYTIDFADMENKIREHQVKAFILCNPHNPVGRVWTRDELTHMAQLCHQYGVVMLSDEIHNDFVFSKHPHTSLMTLDKSLCANSVTFTSASKTFNLAALRCANAIIPDAKRRADFNAILLEDGNNPVDYLGYLATMTAYTKAEAWFDALSAYLKKNAQDAVDRMNQRCPQLRVVMPEGTYLLWIDFRTLGMNPEQLDQFLKQDARLWLNNGAPFGQLGEGFMRMNIAAPHAIVMEGVSRLCAALNHALH